MNAFPEVKAKPLAAGDRVRIKSGKFAGRLATLVSTSEGMHTVELPSRRGISTSLRTTSGKIERVGGAS